MESPLRLGEAARITRAEMICYRHRLAQPRTAISIITSYTSKLTGPLEGVSHPVTRTETFWP